MKRFSIILVIVLTLFASGFCLWSCYGSNSIDREKEIGDPVDSLNSILVYYNGSVSNVSGRHLAKDGYNLGLKYQCVEFVKRYYFEYFKHKMPDSYGHAKDFFKKGLKDGSINTQRNLNQYANPSSSKPAINDLIIFDGNTFNPYGHVAIISKVNENEIEIVQQNPGPNMPSRDTYDLIQENGKWKIGSGAVLGWLRK